MESRKMVLKNLFAVKQWRNKHREQTYGHEEMYGESNMETYITVCKTDSQWELAVCLRELKRALYQPRGVGWRRRWDRGLRWRGHMYTYG